MKRDRVSPAARFAEGREALAEQLKSGVPQQLGKVMEQVEWDFIAYTQNPETREVLAQVFEAVQRAIVAATESAAPQVFQVPAPPDPEARRAWFLQLGRQTLGLFLCVGAAALAFSSPQGFLAAMLMGALFFLLLTDLLVHLVQRNHSGSMLPWPLDRIEQLFRSPERSKPPAPVVSVRHDPAILLSKFEEALPHLLKVADSVDSLVDGPRPAGDRPFPRELCKPGFLGELLQQLLGMAGRHHDQTVAALVREQLPARLRMAGIRVEEFRTSPPVPDDWFLLQVDPDQAEPVRLMEPVFLPLEEAGRPLLAGRVSLREV